MCNYIKDWSMLDICVKAKNEVFFVCLFFSKVTVSSCSITSVYVQ